MIEETEAGEDQSIADPSRNPSSDPSPELSKEAEHEQATRMAARALSRARSSGQKAGPRGGRDRKRGGGASSRDPQLVGSVVEDFLAESGWEGSAALARLAASWPEVVGPDVAAHVVVESWADGEVVLRADSTAWATQVRLLTDSLRRQIEQAVGEGLVRGITVRGPDAPSWRAGPRVVKGRGPRDTYG